MHLPYSQTVFKFVHDYKANTRSSNDEFGKGYSLIWVNMVIVHNNSFMQSTDVTDRNPLLYS
jgi:hypothetical protein